MPNISRVGDSAVGICNNHKHPLSVTGVISSSINSKLLDEHGTPVAVLGDIVTFSCGHTSFISSGTVICTTNGKPLAHVGSLINGNNITGEITSGSNKIQGN